MNVPSRIRRIRRRQTAVIALMWLASIGISGGILWAGGREIAAAVADGLATGKGEIAK